MHTYVVRMDFILEASSEDEAREMMFTYLEDCPPLNNSICGLKMTSIEELEPEIIL